MKSQVSKAFSNDNFLSLASNMSTAVLGLLTFILLTRSLIPRELGEWILYMTAGTFVEMLRVGLTRTATVRFLAGAKGIEAQKLMGSNWVLGFSSAFIMAILIWTVYFLFKPGISNSGYTLFFVWYPILSFLNLPFNMALTILQAQQRFGKLFIVRLLQVGGFMLFLVINFFVLHWGLLYIVYAHLAINLITSLICMIKRWDGLQHLFKANKKTSKTILNFGKYTAGTLIGSNLLKSSDVFLLGLSPFIGTLGVAMYAVPLKLVEMLEIPVRSFAMTAFPKMSKASLNNDINQVKKIFYSYSGGLTFLILPILIIGFIFAEQFVVILGGSEYAQTQDIFRIFCVYGLFIAVDKFTGIGLDSINKPKRNLLKVIYMASANVIGDVVAIFYIPKVLLFLSMVAIFFSTSGDLFGLASVGFQVSMLTILEMVAVVTIFFTLIGIFVGLYFLNKDLSLSLKYIVIDGWKFFLAILMDVKAVFIK